MQKAFNNHMAGYHQGRPSWMDEGFYPVQERIVEGMLVVGNDEEDGVAIVDVGGGMGHDLVELKRKCPELRGRFILQDLGQVIEQIPLPLEGIEANIHDFYTEQPVKGNQSPLNGNPQAFLPNNILEKNLTIRIPRRTYLPPPLRPARLARRRLPAYPPTYRCGYESWIFEITH